MLTGTKESGREGYFVLDGERRTALTSMKYVHFKNRRIPDSAFIPGGI